MAGRPLKFKSVEELESKIDAYFESCFEIDEKGKERQIKPFTVTGLANALDTSRETLLEYEGEVEGREKSKEYADTIKRAKGIIHQYVEEYLFTGKNQTGAIFNLKNNYGWKDKTETDITSDGKPMPILGGYVPNNDSDNQSSES